VTRLAAFWLSGGTIVESTSTTTFGARLAMVQDTWFADHSADIPKLIATAPMMNAALG
jgi:hypothetical protein